jgi:hypothetical protein
MTDSSADEADVRDIATLLAMGAGYRIDLFAILWVQDLENGQFVVQREDAMSPETFDPTLFVDARAGSTSSLSAGSTALRSGVERTGRDDCRNRQSRHHPRGPDRNAFAVGT